MKRGVIQLLQEEIDEALLVLDHSCKETSVYFKFISAKNLGKPRVSIQFDADELELLLDNIGVPLMDDTKIKKSLRKKVQTFLYYLRNGSLTIE